MRKYIVFIGGIVFLPLILEGTTRHVYEVDGAQGIQNAINTSAAYDTVMVHTGTYFVGDVDTFGITMRDSVILISPHSYSVTLSGLNSAGTDTAYHVIHCNFGDGSSHEALIRGFTVTNGAANGAYPHNNGGGIWCYYSSPVIDSCVITSNSAYWEGGGLYIQVSSPTLTCNTISNNSSYWHHGGGLVIVHSSPILTDNTIANNSAPFGGGIYTEYSSFSFMNNTISSNRAAYDGGGLYIYGSSPNLTGNIISNNSAHYYGGGLYLDESSPFLSGNTISNNSSSDGGGLYMYASYSILDGNTISNNSSGLGGGLKCWHSSPTLTGNTIVNNFAAYRGGGLCIDISSPTLTGNVISNNSAGYDGGGLYMFDSSPTITRNVISGNGASYGGGLRLYYSSVKLVKCVMGMNISQLGGAIYSSSNSKIVVDSCFLLDNGNTQDNASGLVYLCQDSGVVSNSNLYYNTYQPDTEIYNLGTTAIRLQNNFWWVTDSASIDSMIEGTADFIPFEIDFVSGVPGEPTSVDSIRNYSDTTYSVIVDSLDGLDTLYLRINGQDRNASMREAAVAILKTSVCTEGIAIALMESDTNSGIYEGDAYVLEAMVNNTIRLDDIYQRVKVNPSGDTITICANIDTSEKCFVIYKPVGIEEHRVEPNYLVEIAPNPFVNRTVIKYQLPEATRVRIKVFDVAGRCVRTLIDKPHKPGYYHIAWNGEDDKGRKLPAGVYFTKVNAGEYKLIKKAIIIR